MQICPLCNALQEPVDVCPSCRHVLHDGGKLSDFLDPYSHYENDEVTRLAVQSYAASDATACCAHVLFCSTCGYDAVINVSFETGY